MSHKHDRSHHNRKPSKSRQWLRNHQNELRGISGITAKPRLEIVLKCDSTGSLEAVTEDILRAVRSEVDVSIIYSGVGDINHSDVLMAETGSRLIAGFQVDVLPGLDSELNEHGVEVRLYNVIYTLTSDMEMIAAGMVPSASKEELTGNARIIALFKSCRKGVIIGCEVLEGQLTAGRHFRIISAMGPVYSGVIESMHREENPVQKATPGQKVGIKIKNFNQAKIGDLVEAYRLIYSGKETVWRPKGMVIRKTAGS